MIELMVALYIVTFIAVYLYLNSKEEHKTPDAPDLYMATQAAPAFEWIIGRKKTMEEWREVALMLNNNAFKQLEGLDDQEFTSALSTILNIKLKEVKQ